MTAGFILYEQDGGIVTLTMNNPATMNALSGEPETRSMEEACQRIDADLSVRCVFIFGWISNFFRSK